ncbi:MAG: hypothetical protein AMXMBFR46_01210 [Acidimicrobiia bacterium]
MRHVGVVDRLDVLELHLRTGDRDGVWVGVVVGGVVAGAQDFERGWRVALVGDGVEVGSRSAPPRTPELDAAHRSRWFTHRSRDGHDRRHLSQGSMNALYDQPDEPVLLAEITAAKIAS